MLTGWLALQARRLGVDYTFGADLENLATVAADTAGGQFDVCFECCGAAPALDLCVRAAASGGTVCVVANVKETVPVRLQARYVDASPTERCRAGPLRAPLKLTRRSAKSRKEPPPPWHRSSRGARLTSSASIVTPTSTPPLLRSWRLAR